MPIHTTYVTGMLTHFAEGVVKYGFWWHDRRRGGRPATPAPPAWHLSLPLAIWAGLAAGALCGALAQQRWHCLAFACPLVVLLAAAVWDLFSPCTVRPGAGADPGRREGAK